jgi:flavin-binding protein dodecin
MPVVKPPAGPALQPGPAARASWDARIRGPHPEGAIVAVVSVIELLAESEQGWEDAARQAVAEAARTIRNIRSVYLSEFQATVENDQVRNFRVNVKVSFVKEGS